MRPGENAADHAAHRHPQEEPGQELRRRPAFGGLAVAGECDHEERHEVDGDDEEDVVERVEDIDRDQRRHEEGLRREHDPVRNDGFGRKNDNEGRKIKRERDHPEERRRGDVRGQMRGDRDQQGRRNGGEPDPGRRVLPGRRRRTAAVGLNCGLERTAGPPQQRTADRDEDDQQIEQESTRRGSARQAC